MGISYNGFNSKVMTFYAGETCEVGKAVTINDDGEAVKPAKDGNFIGICTSLRNGIAGVQLEGYVEQPYTGTAPKAGVNKIVFDGQGSIIASTDTAAQYYRILKVDTENKIVGFII